MVSVQSTRDGNIILEAKNTQTGEVVDTIELSYVSCNIKYVTTNGYESYIGSSGQGVKKKIDSDIQADITFNFAQGSDTNAFFFRMSFLPTLCDVSIKGMFTYDYRDNIEKQMELNFTQCNVARQEYSMTSNANDDLNKDVVLSGFASKINFGGEELYKRG